jgi:hypothetical protein
MNGATAVPFVSTMSPPNMAMTMNTGSSQYFLRSSKNATNSRRKETMRAHKLVHEAVGALTQCAHSAPLLADKLLSRTAEIASASNARWHGGICLCRRAGDRNAVIQAEHCLRVTIYLACGGCRVQRRRCDWHRIYSLTGLTESFGSKYRAIQ